MKFLSSLFSNHRIHLNDYTMEYDKPDDLWYVLRGDSIMYIGDEPSCRLYINTMARCN